MNANLRGIPKGAAVDIPDKVKYTKGEKVFEILCGAFAACTVAAMITLMALGIIDGGCIIILVSLLILYGILSLCAVYPQHTNLFSKPEKISEKGFHTARRALTIARFVFTAALFTLTLI